MRVSAPGGSSLKHGELGGSPTPPLHPFAVQGEAPYNPPNTRNVLILQVAADLSQWS